MRKEPPSLPQQRRALALVLVALVHGALGWLLVAALFQPAPPQIAQRETILYLTPAPRPVSPAPQVQASAPTSAPRPAAPPPIPNYSFVAPTPDTAPVFAAPKNDLGKLMQGCAADKLATLMPEERARCRFAFGHVPPTDVRNGPREAIRGESFWAAERAAAQANVRVPCVTMFSEQVGFSRDTGAMVDPLCVLGELRK